MTFWYWIIAYYLTTLILCWIGLGMESTEKYNKKECLKCCWNAFLFGWIICPIVIFFSLGEGISKLTNRRGKK